MTDLPRWELLVQPAQLAAVLAAPDLRIIDARATPAVAPEQSAALARAYAQAHLPGALHADLNGDLSDLSRLALGRHPLPQSDAFAATLGRWGITPQTQVVVYDAGDGSMAAARLWWLLWLIGHRWVAVLDGGLAAWRAQQLPETDAPPVIPPEPAYPGQFDLDQVADVAEIERRLTDAPGWLVDARAAERFRGEVEPIDVRAGHVPGAVNRPLALNLHEGRFRAPEALREELSAVLQGTPASSAVLMCGSGVTACHLLLAMELAGLTGARIYAGSWSGWIDDSSRPVATK